VISALVHGAIKQCADLARDDLEGMPKLFICAEEIIAFLFSVVPNFSQPSGFGVQHSYSLSDSIRLNYLQNFGWTEEDEYAFAFYAVNLQRILLLSQSDLSPTPEQA
jgi:hypothetical protein